MPTPQSSIEANPHNAEIVRLLGNTLRLLGLALQLKPLPYDDEMLAFLERTAETLNQLAEMNFKVIRGDDSNPQVLPPVLKPVPDEADREIRQELLELNLFYIDRSLSQTLPLLGDNPNNDTFFAQVGQMATLLAPKALMLYQEALAERKATLDEIVDMVGDLKENMASIQNLAEEHRFDGPPY